MVRGRGRGGSTVVRGCTGSGGSGGGADAACEGILAAGGVLQGGCKGCVAVGRGLVKAGYGGCERRGWLCGDPAVGSGS